MSAQDEGGRDPPKPKGKVRAGVGGKDHNWGLERPQNLGKVTSTVLGSGGASWGCGGEGGL